MFNMGDKSPKDKEKKKKKAEIKKVTQQTNSVIQQPKSK
jgi:hypothetical protein